MFNRSHVNIGRATTSQSLWLLLACDTYIMVLCFTHIPFVVNHTTNATPPERPQQLSLKFVNVGDEQKFPKTSVCVILVDLVYLESATIYTSYTSSKIARGLKRSRTTGI